MKKTLPSLRVDERTINNINSAIQKHNKNSLVKMKVSDFRRLAYETLSQLVLKGEI